MPLLAALTLAGALVQAPAGGEGAVISGRVLEAGTGAPVAGAHVVLIVQRQGPSRGPFIDRPPTVATDEGGRFQFTGLEPGRYRVEARKPGFANLPFSGGMPMLDVKAGERRDDVTLTLQRGGVVTGRVVDQYGEPVADVHVTPLRKPPVPATSPRAARGAGGAAAPPPDRLTMAGPGAQTNDVGEFRLHSLAPGEYYVQATPGPGPGGSSSGAGARGAATTMVPTFFPGVTHADAAQPVVVAAGQTVADVVVRMMTAPAFQVSGIVVDEAGQPVANAMVRLVPQARSATVPALSPFGAARTDAQGTFSLNDVTTGAYTLIAVPPRVLARDGSRSAGAGFTAFVGGTVSGGAGGTMVMTESSSAGTVEYRDDAGAQVPVTVSDGSVAGLQVVVRRPASR
jgi:protocatechuate 3,4-dioxygenase beta subunit